MAPPTINKSSTTRLRYLTAFVAVVTLIVTVTVATTGWHSDASAAQTVENLDVVNATGERLNLYVDDVPYDAAPEELVVSGGALQFCTNCNLKFGNHTFRIELKSTGETVATLNTADANAPIEASAQYDYALVIHRDGPGYAISLYRDDVSPMPSGQTRFEVRNVSAGSTFDYVIRPNGENQSTPTDERTGTLSHTQWERNHNVIVNDYEFLVFEAGAAQTKENLVACQGDLELEGLSSVVVYVGGELVPATQLDTRDIDETRSFSRVCRQFADNEAAFQRSSFTDGYALRGYTGPPMTRIHSVAVNESATPSDTGPSGPYATTIPGAGEPNPTPTPTPGPTSTCNGKDVTIDLNINGGNGDGTNGDDVILGTPGPDTIRGRGGNDTICAGDGDDRINAGSGDDTVFGEGGEDLISGKTGNDFVDGGDAADTIRGNRGFDELRGGDGPDRIFGSADNDIVIGQAGDDRLFGNSGDDTVEGGEGNDFMQGNQDRDIMLGGDGNDEMTGNDGDDRLFGGLGRDEMRGGLGDDELQGGPEADRLFGNDGGDTLVGDTGDDFLSGGLGADFCFGGPGTDTFDVPPLECEVENQ